MQNKFSLRKLLASFSFWLIVIATLSVLTLATLTSRSLRMRSEEAFNQETQIITADIQRGLGSYYNALYSAQGLFSSSENVDRAEWRAFVMSLDLPNRYPGVSAVSYAKKVSASEKDEYIAQIQNQKPNASENLKEFNIHPESEKNEYYPITYIEPIETREKTLGFDISSETSRLEAIQKAMDTNMATATDVVRGASTGAKTVIVYIPVYTNGMPINTIEERRAAIRGFVFVGINPETLFNTIANKSTQKQINLSVYDGKVDDSQKIYERSPNKSSYLSQEAKINVGNREWIVDYTSDRRFGQEQIEIYAPYAILVIGLIITAMSVFVISLLTKQRNEIQVRVDKITEELKRSETQLKSIITNVPLIIWATNKSGKITLFEGNGVSDLGLKPGENVGKSIYETYEGPDREDYRKNIDLTLAGKELHFNLQMNDGKVYENWTAPIFDESKNVVGITGVSTNITQQFKTQEELKKLNEMMVNRELKMVELKNKIKELGGNDE